MKKPMLLAAAIVTAGAVAPQASFAQAEPPDTGFTHACEGELMSAVPGPDLVDGPVPELAVARRIGQLTVNDANCADNNGNQNFRRRR